MPRVLWSITAFRDAGRNNWIITAGGDDTLGQSRRVASVVLAPRAGREGDRTRL